MKSVFKTPTHHALTKNIRVPKKTSVQSVFKTPTHHALTKISVSPDRKRIRGSLPPTSPHNSNFIIIHVLNSLQYSCFKAIFDFVYSDVVLVSAKEDLRVYFMFVCFFFDV